MRKIINLFLSVVIVCTLFLPVILDAKSIDIRGTDEPKAIWGNSMGKSSTDFSDGSFQDSNGDFILYGRATSHDYPMKGYVVKVSKEDGSIIWEKEVNDSQFYGGFEASDGNYVLIGNTYQGDYLMILNPLTGEIVRDKTYRGMNTLMDYGFEASDGNYILVGETYLEEFESDVSNGGKDGFVVKVNSEDGRIIWSNLIGGSKNEEFHMGFEGSDGNYILIGESQSSESGDIVDTNLDSLRNDGFVAYIDAETGAVIKTVLIGGSGNDILNYGFEGSDGNYIFLGVTTSSKFGEIAQMSKVSNSFVVKMDSTSGDLIWENLTENTATGGFISGIESINGNYILNSSQYIVMVDPQDGSIVEKKLIEGNGLNQFTNVYETGENEYVITGSTTSSEILGAELNSHGSWDFTALKITNILSVDEVKISSVDKQIKEESLQYLGLSYDEFLNNTLDYFDVRVEDDKNLSNAELIGNSNFSWGVDINSDEEIDVKVTSENYVDIYNLMHTPRTINFIFSYTSSKGVTKNTTSELTISNIQNPIVVDLNNNGVTDETDLDETLNIVEGQDLLSDEQYIDAFNVQADTEATETDDYNETGENTLYETFTVSYGDDLSIDGKTYAPGMHQITFSYIDDADIDMDGNNDIVSKTVNVNVGVSTGVLSSSKYITDSDDANETAQQQEELTNTITVDNQNILQNIEIIDDIVDPNINSQKLDFRDDENIDVKVDGENATYINNSTKTKLDIEVMNVTPNSEVTVTFNTEVSEIIVDDAEVILNEADVLVNGTMLSRVADTIDIEEETIPVTPVSYTSEITTDYDEIEIEVGTEFDEMVDPNPLYHLYEDGVEIENGLPVLVNSELNVQEVGSYEVDYGYENIDKDTSASKTIVVNVVEKGGITDPEVTDPEVTDPEVTDPEVTDPEVTIPDIAATGFGFLISAIILIALSLIVLLEIFKIRNK